MRARDQDRNGRSVDREAMLDSRAYGCLKGPDIGQELKVDLFRTVIGHVGTGAPLYSSHRRRMPRSEVQRDGRIQIMRSLRGRRTWSVPGLVPSMTQFSSVRMALRRPSASSRGRSCQPGIQNTSRSIETWRNSKRAARARASVLLPLPEQPITRMRRAVAGRRAASSRQVDWTKAGSAAGAGP